MSITDEQKEAIVNSCRVLNYKDKKTVWMIANKGESLLPGIRGHILRVAYYTQLLVNEIYERKLYKNIVTKEYVEMLPISAAIHDVGKLFLPKEIVNAPRKLTKQEYEIMKLHISYGNELIKKALESRENEKFLKLTQDVVTYHHERYDGNGYLLRLKGKKIPLSGRIVAIADIYDAIKSSRTYKKALSQEETIEYMKSVSGKDVDPELLDIFLSDKIQKQIKEILILKHLEE